MAPQLDMELCVRLLLSVLGFCLSEFTYTFSLVCLENTASWILQSFRPFFLKDPGALD